MTFKSKVTGVDADCGFLNPEDQRRGFDWTLTAVTIFCITLSTVSTLVGTPLVQSIFEARQKRKESHQLQKMQKRSTRKSRRLSAKEIELRPNVNMNPLYRGSAHKKNTLPKRVGII